MNNEFEYDTYADDEWPVDPEHEDVDFDDDEWDPGTGWVPPVDRTEVLISHGRTSAPSGRLAGARRAASARLSGGLLTGTGPLPVASGGAAGPGSGQGRPSGSAAAPGTATPGTGKPGKPARAPRARRRLSKPKLILTGAAALALGIALAILLQGPGPGWPSSVATVKQEIQVACKNPDVASDPGQVNFACGPDTSQVLWVFALLTSNDNPAFTDPSTGREGLEPITAAQGGEVAWSLNLYHPYNPLNPTDSLEVAARAINNIIGGATVTGQNGKQVVQAGLEASPANCEKYTGSAALVTRQGYPAICASPITSAQGREALVSDVYQQWMVGAPARDAQNAALLFANASNPGNAQVQAILHSLAGSGH
jgi:hypothetical protein